jgi:nitroreductase
MEFEQVIKKRRMMREFDPNKQIPDKVITKLFRNAHRAPIQHVIKNHAAMIGLGIMKV